MITPSGVSKLNEEIDEKIRKASKLLETVSDRPNLEYTLLSAKLMKKKFVAMTALATAQTVLAEMGVLVAENNLKTALGQLAKFTKDYSEVPGTYVFLPSSYLRRPTARFFTL